jgi:hypothetical protein
VRLLQQGEVEAREEPDVPHSGPVGVRHAPRGDPGDDVSPLI